ncbi:MAG: LysR family transcriptional regulator [Oscillospiraceae bacterium]|nr:LysR family transcriptional regulator [Oscillospiraceae bacterium]
MTSLQITYFLKVCEYMSFSRAAQTLFVSQPSVSRQIQMLEQELEVKLFDRSRRNAIRLTTAGVLFRDSFLRSRESFDQAMAAARARQSGDLLELRVGVGYGWDMSRQMLAFRRQIAEHYPSAQLTFEMYSFQELHARLQRGKLDVMLCTQTCVKYFENIEIYTLGNMESTIYVRRGLLRPAGEKLQLSDFHDQDLLVLPEDESPMAGEFILLQFQSHRVRPNVVTLPNRESIYQALLMGDGFTVFDDFTSFADDPRLESCLLEDHIPLCAVWRKGDNNPLLRLFGEVMSEAMALGRGK